MSFLKNINSSQLIHPEITDQHIFTNVLLIDSNVKNYEQIVDSVNSSTFPIVYSTTSSKKDLLSLLEENFTSIERIAICFTSSLGNKKLFLDNEFLFSDKEYYPYSDNLQCIIDILKKYNVKNIDFLVCNFQNGKNILIYCQKKQMLL